MRYIWEEKDLDCWTYFICNSSPVGSKDFSFVMSVLYRLCWTNEEKQKKCIVSLSDGMIEPYESTDKLLNRLNKNKHGYRKLNESEVAHILKQFYIKNL